MANMSYCRFENTHNDLLDCEEALAEGDKDLSDTEVRCAKVLLEICSRISRTYTEQDIDDMREE